jgi:hypothetical protein
MPASLPALCQLRKSYYNYTMPHTCPHCRATFPGEETCQERFNISQLKEVEQPAYYAVHCRESN